MVIIHNYSEEKSYITLEISKISDVHTLSELLDRLFDNVFVDWIFLFEELDDKTKGGILNKKIKILKRKVKNGSYIVVSVHNENTVAIVKP
ncbi:MAG: hypothetical protein GXO22_08940 [Aquificae bacterium]|nr:hypothetical protein [Aquificota bacterium]